MLEVADKVIDGIKTVREIASKIENAELLNQVADLMGDSADLKMEIAEANSHRKCNGSGHLRDDRATRRAASQSRGRGMPRPYGWRLPPLSRSWRPCGLA